MRLIPSEKYAKILKNIPILCVDIILKNENGQYLLVKRTNEPLKDHWWVVGGRVHKGETMKQAAIRKIKEEVSLDVDRLDFVGYYEGIFNESAFDIKTPVHTVSIVFLAAVESGQKVTLDAQSSEWRYARQLPEQFIINKS